MKNTRAEKLIAAYLSGNSVAREEEELMAWVDESPEGQKFFDNAVELWNITDQGDYPDFSKGKKQAWDRLDANLFAEKKASTPTAKIRPMYIRVLAVAASLALLIAAGWWWQSSSAFSVQTLVAEQIMVELPDGTKVWLNENSLLLYEDKGQERSLTFEGEAYFDVATDSLKPFRIYAGRAVTTVMGTEFNLRAYPDEDAVEVSVTEGKVALTKVEDEAAPKQETNKIELTVGQTGVFEKEDAIVKILEKETAQNKTAWKEQKLNFSGLTLAQIIPAVERYFGVEIVLENKKLLNCPSDKIDFDHPKLEDVVNGISFIFEFETTIDDNRILLKGGNSCE